MVASQQYTNVDNLRTWQYSCPKHLFLEANDTVYRRYGVHISDNRSYCQSISSVLLCNTSGWFITQPTQSLTQPRAGTPKILWTARVRDWLEDVAGRTLSVTLRPANSESARRDTKLIGSAKFKKLIQFLFMRARATG